MDIRHTDSATDNSTYNSKNKTSLPFITSTNHLNDMKHLQSQAVTGSNRQ